MAEQFYTLLTNIGKAKMANACMIGTKVNITSFAVGDGNNGAYYNPTEELTSLKHEVWRGPVRAINIDEHNPNWIVIEAVIPTTDGGFMVREAAIFNDAGDMIAIGKYPETYKPVMSEGSAKDLYIRLIIEVSNATSVTLKVDPTVILATKKDIEVLQNSISNIKIPTKASDIGAETPSGAQAKIDGLAGAGNTKTVKQVADEVESHWTDNAKQIKVKSNITILATGWTLDATTQLYKYDIADTDITPTTIVDVNIKIAYLEKAGDLKSANESFEGYVRLYADSIPASNIICDLKLIRQVF